MVNLCILYELFQVQVFGNWCQILFSYTIQILPN